MSLVNVIETTRRDKDWNRLVVAIPYMQFLGARVELREGQLIGVMPFSSHLVGNPTLPALHGGTLGGMLEAAAQFELMFRAESLVLPKTITITVDFLRSGKPVDTYFSAHTVKQGRRVTTVHSVAWQDDLERPIATANVHLLVLGT